MIELKGLTHLQIELADQIWQRDSLEDVNSFIEGLPKNLRAKARGVFDLILAQALDQVEDVGLARSVLAEIAN
jgi:hypothetical protein